MPETEFSDGTLLSTEERELKRYNRFWLGFFIYTIGYIFSHPVMINYALCQGVQLVGLFILIPAAFKLIYFHIYQSYLRIIYPVYLIWLILIMVRGFSMNWDFIKSMLFDAWFGIFLYFVPLVLLITPKINFYKKAFKIIIILGIVYLIYCAFHIKILLTPDIKNLTSQYMIEYISKTLAIPCGFILFTYLYNSPKRKVFALAVMLITFLLATIRARRGLMFIALMSLIIAYFNYLYTNRGSSLKWVFSLILVGLVVAYGYRVYNSNKTGIFDSITGRMDANTRTGVEDYFYADMDTQDWIIGRGINGQYYCPGIDSPTSIYRPTIETDYLQIILKGGLISLGLLLLIAIPAVIKGLFSSKNMLSKGAAFWILLWIMSLYPSNVTTFTLNYILVWISIGICYSDEIRNIPESKMIAYFRPDGENDNLP